MSAPAARADARTRLDDALLLGADLLHVDRFDSLRLLVAGDYEPYETSLLMRLALPGTTVLDIGANIGFHTLQFARAVGPAGRVVAFEPAPENLRLLRHNLRTNGCGNVTVVPAAVVAEACTLTLYQSTENQGDHRIYDSGDAREAVEVRGVSVDEALSDLTGPVSLIKLDIQGAEPGAIAGMERLLAAHPEAWIATELWPFGLERAGSSVDAYLAQLRATGAALVRIDERRRRLMPLDLDWLAATVTVERRNHTNLLLPRRDWVRRG